MSERTVELKMPKMGEKIESGTITKWLVEVGAEIERDQPLVGISTDKVDAEIPSPVGGRLVEIVVAQGDTALVDAVLGKITTTEPPQIPASEPIKPKNAGLARFWWFVALALSAWLFVETFRTPGVDAHSVFLYFLLLFAVFRSRS